MPSQSNQLLTAITNVVKAMKHPELMCSDGFTHNDPSIHGDYGWAGKFNFMERDYLALGKNNNGNHWIGAAVESGYEFEDVGVYDEDKELFQNTINELKSIREELLHPEEMAWGAMSEEEADDTFNNVAGDDSHYDEWGNISKNILINLRYAYW